MKKIGLEFMVLLTMVLGLGMGTSALARTTGNGVSQVGVTFTSHTSKLGSGAGADVANEAIPTGENPVRSSKGATSTVNKKASPAAAVATVVKAGSADLIAGRLPQTSESRMFLTSIFGLLLLIVLILSVTVYRQARLLRERE